MTPGLREDSVYKGGISDRTTLKGLLAPKVLNGMSESILETLSYLIYRG